MDHKDLADIGQRSEDKVNNNGTSALPTQGVPGPGLPGILGGLPGLLAQSTEGGDGQLASVYSLITNIQAMIKVAVENAKKEERSLITEKGKYFDFYFKFEIWNLTLKWKQFQITENSTNCFDFVGIHELLCLKILQR